jgi:hypothetical protein
VQPARQLDAQQTLRTEQARAHRGGVDIEALRGFAYVETFHGPQHEHHPEVLGQRIDGML